MFLSAPSPRLRYGKERAGGMVLPGDLLVPVGMIRRIHPLHAGSVRKASLTGSRNRNSRADEIFRNHESWLKIRELKLSNQYLIDRSDSLRAPDYPRRSRAGGTSFVTTLPAPIIAPSPTVIPQSKTAPEPMDTPRLTSVGMHCQSASVCNWPSSLVGARIEIICKDNVDGL